MTEVHEDLRGDTRPQTRRNNQALFKSLYQDMKDASTKSRKEWVVTNGVRLSIYKVFDVSCGE